MTDLYFMRHGPTHAKTMVGRTDIPADLSDHGQIARISNFVPDTALVVSSDLIRCTATADAVQGARRRLPHMEKLREFDFGEWEGMSFAQVSERDPELSRAYWETPGDICAPNGESWNMTAARANAAVDGVIAKYPDQSVLIVAHFGIILTQLRRAMGKTAAQVLAQKIDNFSLTHIQYNAGEWRVMLVNHLP